MAQSTRTKFVSALRDMKDAELDKRIQELRRDVSTENTRRMRFKMGYGAEKGAILARVKRDLARALTIQRERVLEGLARDGVAP